MSREREGNISQADLLKSQLEQINNESSISSTTDTEIFKKRYSILTQLAKLESKKEEDVIGGEINRANNLENKFCELYKKERDALSLCKPEEKVKYNNHIKVLKEYDNVGICENWIPPFSTQRIFLYTRQEQLKNTDIVTAMGKAFKKEGELIGTKADEVYKRAIYIESIVLEGKADELRGASKSMKMMGNAAKIV